MRDVIKLAVLIENIGNIAQLSREKSIKILSLK